MHGTSLGHNLETLHDGLTTFCGSGPVPMPLVATRIDVSVQAGVAIVRTTRSFRNAEGFPIEAVMTFPVGFDAVLTGMAATIGGRRMVAKAQEREEARDTYEKGLDEGRLSVLHEEVLRGIHVLSVGALPPGSDVEVQTEQVVSLSDAGGVPFLRVPMTAGQLYGTSPLLPADDLATSDAVRHEATLTVRVDEGHAVMGARALAQGEPVEILLNRAMELRIEGGVFGMLQGRSADGRQVDLSLRPSLSEDKVLDLHVLFDRSGSTGSTVSNSGVTVWEAMRNGLASELSGLDEGDRITLWQWDSDCTCLGSAEGSSCGALANRLEGPRGGTELGRAIEAALDKGAKDLLVLTDGQTWAHIVEELKGNTCRVSAILVGRGSLDANIGHLCAMTGGQVFYAPGEDVGSALRTAFRALRTGSAAIEGEIGLSGPDRFTTMRGGVVIEAQWVATQHTEREISSDAVGRYAAALSLPLLGKAVADAWARAHDLCTHSTSLVLVDQTGEATEGFSRMRKVPLMEPYSAPKRNSKDNAGTSRRAGYGYSVPGRVKLGIGLSRPTTAMSRSISRRAISPGPELDPKRLLVALFRDVAWDRNGDAFLAGDFTALSPDQQKALTKLSAAIERERSSKLVSDNPFPNARLLALGLIALWLSKIDVPGERLAGRFARRVLRDAPHWARSIRPTINDLDDLPSQDGSF